MISQLVVSPDRNRADLVGEVQAAWNKFENAIPNHPLANVPTRFQCQWREDTLGVARAIAELAADPANDTGKIVLGQRFLDTAYPVAGRNLTLLHESIHLILQTGAQRNRTGQVEQMRTQRLREHNRLWSTAPPDADREAHEFHRLMLGFQFVNMPDEVWAELFLRDNYPATFGDRMALYLSLRDDPARRTEHPDLPPSIRKFYLVYQWLALELARRIDDDTVRLRRLGELQTDWRTDLGAMIGDDGARDLLERAGALLPDDVAAMNPAQFDEFFDDIRGTPLTN